MYINDWHCEKRRLMARAYNLPETYNSPCPAAQSNQSSAFSKSWTDPKTQFRSVCAAARDDLKD